MRRIETADDIAAGLAALARADPGLKSMIDRAGPVPLRRRPAGYRALAEIVLSQMVSKASADALWRKLETASGGVSPKSVLALDPALARAAGLSGAKDATLRRLAAAVVGGQLDLDGLCRVPSPDAVSAMTAIKGIGPWTAEVYLLFCAGHPDVFPAGDVALQNAAAHGLALNGRPSARALAGIAQGWAPWRGVAARLLWAYYATHMRREATPIGG